MSERNNFAQLPHARAGHAESEIVGRTTEFLHVDNGHFLDFDRESSLGLAAQSSFYGEFEMRKSNGEIFPTSHVVSMFSDDASGDYALSVVRDESQSKQYQAEIRQQAEQLRDIAENLREVFWISDPDKSRMLYVSLGDRACYPSGQ